MADRVMAQGGGTPHTTPRRVLGFHARGRSPAHDLFPLPMPYLSLALGHARHGHEYGWG